MRIAHLPSSYLPDSLGGTEIYVRNLCEALAGLGHQNAVVWHNTSAPSTSLTDSRERLVRLPPHQLRRRSDIYARRSGRNPPGFAEFLASWQPDVLHFHAFTLGAGLDHCRVAADHGIPYVVTYHTPTFSCQRGTLMRWGEEVCEGRIQPRQCAACSLHADGFPQAVSQLLACSPLSASRWPDGPWIPRLARRSLLQGKRNSFSEFMNGAAQVIACASWCRDVLLRNGVSPERVQVRRQALPGRSRTVRLKFPQKKSIKIGFIGRFTWVKGPDLFLRALQELRQRGIDARGSLIGPIAQNEREWAESLLRRYAENAVYDGVKQGEELDSWLRSLDLVLVPSRCLETGPLTVLEAWDAGLPVVGANLGGIAEFLRDAGMESLLFTANDATAAAQAVIRATRWKGDVKTEVRGMAELAQSMADVYSDVCSRGKPIAA